MFFIEKINGKKRAKNLILFGLSIVFTFACLTVKAAPGDLDVNFGDSGVAITSFGSGQAWAFASVVQTDDKIVAAGGYYNGSNWDIALARYNPDGTLDPTFGSSGKVTTINNGTSDEQAYAVALQPDGKIVVAGYAVVTYPYSG